MLIHFRLRRVRLCLGLSCLVAGGYLMADDRSAPSDTAAGESAPVSNDKAENRVPPVPLEVARDRVGLLQEVYKSTMEVMHHRYFHGERAVVPARAMEDVFSDMKERSAIEARWIAVSLKAMSVNHEPKTDFEKFAVQQIKSGKREVERVEKGYYRKAVAIPLTGGCLSCHDGFFRSTSPSTKFAGLVISMPIETSDQTP